MQHNGTNEDSLGRRTNPRALTGTRAESRRPRHLHTVKADESAPAFRTTGPQTRNLAITLFRAAGGCSSRTSGGDLPSSTVTGPRDDGLVYGNGRVGKAGFLALRREL